MSVIRDVFTELSDKYFIQCSMCFSRFKSSSDHYKHLMEVHASAPLPEYGMDIMRQAEDKLKLFGYELCMGSGYLGIHPDGVRISIARSIESCNGNIDDAIKMILAHANTNGNRLYL